MPAFIAVRSDVRTRAGLCFVLSLSVVLVACGGDPDSRSTAADAAPSPATAAAEPEILYWYDPMRPEVHFDAPGRSPFMAMDLVPMYAESDGDAGSISVPASLTQSLGVRLAEVERVEFRSRLRAAARVRVDEDSRRLLVARVPGWVERLHVHEVGASVRAGEVLIELYSPDLVRTQEELLLSPAAASGAMERLRRLGIAEVDIDALRKSGRSQRRLPLRAPVSGTVAMIGVHHGARVLPERTLLEIVADDRVWVDVELFPGQAERLVEPVLARFRLSGRTDYDWQGRDGILYPLADPIAQTQALRFAVAESSRRLPPGIWLEAELRGAARTDVLSVPSEAVIRTGHGGRVVQALSESRYRAVPVIIGERQGARTEILDGLREGDRIVVSGQFLLDSEAELRSGFARLSAGESGRSEPVTAEAENVEAGHRHAH